jgi:hypothetical protein
MAVARRLQVNQYVDIIPDSRGANEQSASCADASFCFDADADKRTDGDDQGYVEAADGDLSKCLLPLLLVLDVCLHAEVETSSHVSVEACLCLAHVDREKPYIDLHLTPESCFASKSTFDAVQGKTVVKLSFQK